MATGVVISHRNFTSFINSGFMLLRLNRDYSHSITVEITEKMAGHLREKEQNTSGIRDPILTRNFDRHLDSILFLHVWVSGDDVDGGLYLPLNRSKLKSSTAVMFTTTKGNCNIAHGNLELNGDLKVHSKQL
ncbi:hypothetical protein L1987_32620 [Smallanthus sonchifolius]|uniref:Uncharacterized protein n=1 Tax=Smallanthus sonchifolius TaxID=185202 RepID=A0ACB9HN76_9ASTR|nr:hypothetical protein L1987_32620 [Smallanthus sonchifolius]